MCSFQKNISSQNCVDKGWSLYSDVYYTHGLPQVKVIDECDWIWEKPPLMHTTLNEAHKSSTTMDIVYLDIRKAFDLVLHMELLTKLWPLRIHWSLWYWFNTYLTNRRQSVCVIQWFYLRSAARAIWGTSGQPSLSTFIYFLCKSFFNSIKGVPCWLINELIS